MKVSIVIPTYNHCEDCLKPCIQSIRATTDLSSTEIIVVANGCTDNTEAFLRENKDIVTVWSDAAIGYPMAVNAGIIVSKGDYIVLLNNDCVLLDNTWLPRLLKPFEEDPTTGISGPCKLGWDCAGIRREFMAFWCVMIPRQLINKIGKLDDAFTPGMGEDGDFSIRAVEAGYKLVQVPLDFTTEFGTPEAGCKEFPIFHRGNATFNENEFDKKCLIARNSKILADRYGKTENQVKYSIVIPTYNHLEDCLKPCCEAIIKYTDFVHGDVEIIVVANGCTDGTKEYLATLPPQFKSIWSDEPLGFTKATNLGIKAAAGEFVVLLNNDAVLLEQEPSTWLKIMEKPFIDDPNMGITGPLSLFDPYANRNVLIFFCVMIRSSLFQKLGVLNEDYSPGGGEDIDFTCRVEDAGYKALRVPAAEALSFDGKYNVGSFPIWHRENGTFGQIPEYGRYIIKNNGLKNLIKYNKNIRLNFGAGGVEIPGYLSVDLHDERSKVLMDITKPLPLKTNSVEEIIASHLFEHLNPYRVQDILKEWRRVLKYGGKLVMEMPHTIELLREVIAAHDRGDKAAVYGYLNNVYGVVNTTDVGDQSDITSSHLWGWYPETVSDFLHASGYVNIRVGPEQFPHPGKNFRIEAEKPWLPDGCFSEYNIHTYRTLAEKIPQNGQMAEVGVWRGKSLCSIADILDARKVTIYAIDHFQGTNEQEDLQKGDDGTGAEVAKNIDVKGDFYRNAHAFLIDWYLKVIDKDTQVAVHELPDDLDFIFIDANHTYPAVKADIQAYWRKLKVGGILAGHDYAEDHPGVVQAVNEIFPNSFQEEHGIWWTTKNG